MSVSTDALEAVLKRVLWLCTLHRNRLVSTSVAFDRMPKPDLSVEDDGIKGLWIWDRSCGRVVAELDDIGRVVKVCDYLSGDLEVDPLAAGRWEKLRHEAWLGCSSAAERLRGDRLAAERDARLAEVMASMVGMEPLSADIEIGEEWGS